MRLLPSRGPGWTSYPRMVLDASYEFVLGVRYGYPLCCIARYCLDNFLYRLSHRERGLTFKRHLNDHNEDGGYVPCPHCMKAAKAEGSWRG